MARIAVAAAALLLLCALAPDRGADDGEDQHVRYAVTKGTRVRLPVAFHVAHAPAAVADQAFLDAELERANAIWNRYGVGFGAREQPILHGHARMDSRADRDALGSLVLPEVINCFVVAALRDVDDPSRMRQGVHWRSRTVAGAHYVILSAIAHVDVLAHELGHFLGNPRHSDTPGNLMSYRRAEGLPFLDERQLRRTHRRIDRYLREHELQPL